MGVIYIVHPLGPDIVDWLQEQQVDYPENLSGRHPTPDEIRAAAGELKGFRVEETGPYPDGRWQLVVTAVSELDAGPWAMVNTRAYTDADKPCAISFEKGWPELIVELLCAVSKTAGPLVLIPDTGCPPVVLWAGRAGQSALADWEHVKPAAN